MRCLWDPICSVGVEQLDRQHQSILEKLGDLERELSSGDPVRVARRVASLAQECAFHFEAEEEFLEGLRYPGLAEQTEAHREFLDRLAGVEAHPETCAARTLEELAKWLEEHVLGLDAEYARWMRERAVRIPEAKTRPR